MTDMPSLPYNDPIVAVGHQNGAQEYRLCVEGYDVVLEERHVVDDRGGKSEWTQVIKFDHKTYSEPGKVAWEHLGQMVGWHSGPAPEPTDEDDIPF